MGRPKKIRKMLSMPSIAGFKPYGRMTSSRKRAPVFLFSEEYEALRLHDYKKCTQLEAAQIMQVSRPTFTRIYMAAREKIATAFVEGRQISIEGGKVKYDKEWYCCSQCRAIFNIIETVSRVCPLCGNTHIYEYSDDKGEDDTNSDK